ncbi:CVNH domain-containing protein [Xanthobacter sediminis]
MVLAAPLAAQGLPAGSYLATCRDVRVSAGWLTASCQDRSGRWVESTTAASWCSRGDIANENGRLTCKPVSSFGEQAPAGSYMASCRDIRVSAGWLKASCQDRNGRWVDATTAVSWCSPGRDIANMDGRLTCK